jgi:DNA polymerase III delta prime subunit
MEKIKGSLAAVGLFAGSLYLVGEYIAGKGNCGKAIMSVLPGVDMPEEGFFTACLGDWWQGKEVTEAQITGPEIRAARLANTHLTMTFGEIEVEVVFPKEGDQQTQVEWDPAFWGHLGPLPIPKDFDGVTDVIIKVDPEESVAVNIVPCARLAEDYSEGIVLPGSGVPDDEALQSHFDISYKLSEDQTSIVSIEAVAPGLEACFTHIPTKNSFGATNDVPYVNGGSWNNQEQIPLSIFRTFDLVLRDMAMYDAMASDCVSAIIDEESVKQEISKFIAGSVSAQLGGIAINPDIVEVRFSDQESITNRYKQAYLDIVEKYSQLERTLPETGEDRPFKVKFSDDITKIITDCGKVVSG